MDGLFTFLASRNGRITRAVIGVILLIVGLAIGFETDSVVGWIITTYSIFLLLETGLDLVLLAPFAGKSMAGPVIRAERTSDDPLAELKRLQPALDDKSIALLNLMRYWLFGTFMIVSAAVYTYVAMFTNDNDLVEAFNNAWPILAAVAVLCVLTYAGYWWYITRIKIRRADKTAPKLS